MGVNNGLVMQRTITRNFKKSTVHIKINIYNIQVPSNKCTPFKRQLVGYILKLHIEIIRNFWFPNL